MSINYNIKLGDPPGMIVDCSMDHYVDVFANETNKSLLECIADILHDKQDIHLCLSGGLDSQFSLLYCLELEKNVTAYTYRSIWKDTILNVEDVYIAEQLAKKYNFKHHIIDIDLYEFYESKMHFKYGPDFLNNSPQLSVHFYFIELLKEKFNIDHILLGGDPPLLRYKEIKHKSKNLNIVGEHFLQDIMAPYYFFCESIGVECIRDIYFHSPEAVYKSYLNNLDVIKNKGVYASTFSDFDSTQRYRRDIYMYKYEYYKNIIPNLIPQKSETTGFENLKKILATETGIYNQYNLLYRNPQIDIETKSPRARHRARRLANPDLQASYKDKQKSKLGRFSRNIKYPGIISDIYIDFLTYIDQNELECVNRYLFDF
jgi:hypothetical protein|tara:strand:- start:2414 stop:3532 length:1119 start_codon:yes stop_codon:yes gene_type:complete